MKQNNLSRFTSDDSILKASMLTEIRHFFKIILMGDSGVGKTAIIDQYTENQYTGKYKCTINAEFKIKSILLDDNTWVEMNIWDTCGQERFRALTRQYYKDAHGKLLLIVGCILVFDITSRESFEAIEEWISELKSEAPDDITILIVGNKEDLESKRVVSKLEAESLALKYRLTYIESSAKKGLNINILFEFLCKSMIKKFDYIESRLTNRTIDSKNNNITLQREEDKKEKEKEVRKKGCCKK